MLNAVLFAIIEDAASTVLILTEDADQDELLASRLTCAEVQRQLLIMTGMIAEISAATRDRMPELEWAGWKVMTRALKGSKAKADEALWFAVRSLVPATIMWLRVYRQKRPELFTFYV